MTNRFRVFLSLALLYAMFIFYLSSNQSASSPVNMIHLYEPILKFLKSYDLEFISYPFYLFAKYPDKTAHMVLYAGFGFLLYLTLKNSPYQSLRNNAFLFAIIIGTLYGATDEFHQSFVPGRTESIYDLFADSIGVTFGQTIIVIKDKLYNKLDKTT
jgi:VanZ family protein